MKKQERRVIEPDLRLEPEARNFDALWVAVVGLKLNAIRPLVRQLARAGMYADAHVVGASARKGLSDLGTQFADPAYRIDALVVNLPTRAARLLVERVAGTTPVVVVGADWRASGQVLPEVAFIDGSGIDQDAIPELVASVVRSEE